jgi:hypothetical protein
MSPGTILHRQAFCMKAHCGISYYTVKDIAKNAYKSFVLQDMFSIVIASIKFFTNASSYRASSCM